MDKNGQKTILLANHSAMDLPRVETILRRNGWRVLISGNAMDTFSILRKETPEIILLKPSAEPIPEYEVTSINKVIGSGQKVIIILETIPNTDDKEINWTGIDDFFIGDSLSELASRAQIAYSRFNKEQALQNTITTLQEQSITDYKTGLYNDRYILRRLVEEFQRVERHLNPLSIIMADVDGFKDLNDTNGHQFGDFVLQAMATHITSIIRKIDIPGRYGGDEFLILLPNTGIDEATTIADRIRSFLDQHKFEKDDHTAKVTLSQGLDTYSGDDTVTCDQFLKNADKALFEAKQRGKNRICLFPLI